MFCDACTKAVFKFAKQPATTPVDPLCNTCAHQLNLWLSQEKVENICSILNYLSPNSLLELNKAIRHLTEKPTGGASIIPPAPQKAVWFMDLDQNLTVDAQHELLDLKMDAAKEELANLARHKQILLDDATGNIPFKKPTLLKGEPYLIKNRPPTPMPKREHIPGFTPAQSITGSPMSEATSSRTFWTKRNTDMECPDEMVEDDVYYSSDTPGSSSPCFSDTSGYSITVCSQTETQESGPFNADDIEEDCSRSEMSSPDSGYMTSEDEQYDEMAAIESYLKTIKVEQQKEKGQMQICPPSVAFMGPPAQQETQLAMQDKGNTVAGAMTSPIRGPLKMRLKACPNKPGAWQIN